MSGTSNLKNFERNMAFEKITESHLIKSREKIWQLFLNACRRYINTTELANDLNNFKHPIHGVEIIQNQTTMMQIINANAGKVELCMITPYGYMNQNFNTRWFFPYSQFSPENMYVFLNSNFLEFFRWFFPNGVDNMTKIMNFNKQAPQMPMCIKNEKNKHPLPVFMESLTYVFKNPNYDYLSTNFPTKLTMQEELDYDVRMSYDFKIMMFKFKKLNEPTMNIITGLYGGLLGI